LGGEGSKCQLSDIIVKLTIRQGHLAPVKDADFSFTIAPELGITSAVVTRMRLTLKNSKKERITLEANAAKNPKVVYELRDELHLPPHFITQLGVKVTFEAESGKRLTGSYPEDISPRYPVAAVL
jgi:hypothetical protein